MPRLSQISDQTASKETMDIFKAIKSKIGMVPNLYRVAANQPATLRALLGANDALAEGSFSAHDREAIALAVAGANGCDYCASAHAAISAGMKVQPTAVDDHLRGRSRDPRLQAMLALSLAIVEHRGTVTDADLGAARTAGLADADITEVVANVVVNIFTNYLNNVAETDIDFPVRHTGAAR